MAARNKYRSGYPLAASGYPLESTRGLISWFSIFDMGTMDEQLHSLVDWQNLLTIARIEQWTGNDDGYWISPNNYRVYFEHEKPMVMTPWDTDSSFYIAAEDQKESENPNSDKPMQVVTSMDIWEEPSGMLLQTCFLDESCTTQWQNLGSIVSDRLTDGSLYELAIETQELIQEGRIEDPRSNCPRASQLSETNAILEYVRPGDGGTPVEEKDSGCNQLSSQSNTPLWRWWVGTILWWRRTSIV